MNDILRGADDGDLYLEYSENEHFLFSEGRLRASNLTVNRGFGLRCISDDVVGFAHSSEFSSSALERAVSSVKHAKLGKATYCEVSPPHTDNQVLIEANPIQSPSIERKLGTLGAIEAYAHSCDPRVFRVNISMTSKWSAVEILRCGGERYADRRPLSSLRINIAVAENGLTESGTSITGARTTLDPMIDEDAWRTGVEKALRSAITKLQARPAPAGERTVVLAQGWPGVMVHEAVGHGLEGDAIRKGESVYEGKVGEQVAARGVTIIDQGNIKDKRGSLNIDDEGTPTRKTVLIENGVLKGYLHDRHSARKMGVEPTGNGRRESYAHLTLPRMTNTFLANGDYSPEEIVGSVKDGVYAASLGGGQVNPVTGDFVFECTEAFIIRDGNIEEPIKGASLIGNGPIAIKSISMVGDNSELDTAAGVCGKQGQNIPVCVGQPTVRMEKMIIGGTA